MNLNLWISCNRRHTGDQPRDEEWNTTSVDTFTGSQAEVNSVGVFLGAGKHQHPALGNTAAWNNWYNYVSAMATALAEYDDVIGYWSASMSPTAEWGTLYEAGEDGTFHPDTVRLWQSWHLQTYGTAAPPMAKRWEANSQNKTRTGRFHSWALNQILNEFATRIKNVNNRSKVIFHGSSFVCQTFIRTDMLEKLLMFFHFNHTLIHHII
jgi:hypothetical protein